jgi:flavin reductase (DIM6/NTAB) family NADH-FMN oxidoreductase RutF
MPDGRAEIHSEDPFRTPLASRTPARRFRGRLIAPVTIWTAGRGDDRTGLTVSSVLVAEGEPSLVLGLINDTTDLWERIEETGAFIVHVLREGEVRLAERFAGTRPSPGGLFEGLDTTDSEYGPVLTDHEDRVLCRFIGATVEGYHRLVRGRIEEVELGQSGSPLAHHRGKFHDLGTE